MIKNKLLFAIALVAIFITLGLRHINTTFINSNFIYANTQLKSMLRATGNDNNSFPRTTNIKGEIVTTSKYDWTPGFFPGNLWYTYEYTKDETLKNAAVQWTEKMESVQHYTEHHDLGFMMYCSYGNAYRIVGDENYKKVIIQSAKSLSTRYNPKTKCIKSWNAFNSWHGNNTYYFPVIIDNMMNLELLFSASKFSGDSSFKNIAINHAIQTLKNQIREDYSCYHVVCYDSLTGNVIGKETAQGYADNSTWARGQAWGIYGFTMAYRETKDNRFLEAAQGMANFFIYHKNLPKDKIPYWDFNALEKGYTPGINSHAKFVRIKYRDASAAAITASALLELSTYGGNNAKKYKQDAIKILHALSSKKYKSDLDTNGNFLLKHCVGSIPHESEIDVPLVYADYYFLEAMHRLDQLNKNNTLF